MTYFVQSWCVGTDLAGEVMVHSQTQSLFLKSNKSRRALLTAPSRAPVARPPPGPAPPWPATQRHPHALFQGHIVRSVAHGPARVVPGPLRSGDASLHSEGQITKRRCAWGLDGNGRLQV